jgi:nitronate monooxygenase
MVLDELDVPVVLAPMGGGPSTPRLAAAVTDAGGLGFLAGAYLGTDDLAARIAETRALTDGPVGVNVFAPVPGPADPAAYREQVGRIAAWAAARGLPVGEPRHGDDGFAAKLAVLEEAPVSVVSVAFGCPDAALVGRLQAAGKEVWVTVTTAAEARAAAAVGADVLVAQGAEAGGHRGSFADDDEQPLSLLALLQLVRAACDLPLVGAGAVMTGDAVAAVLCAGARAAQVGTAFLRCPEAGTAAAHRQALAGDRPTAATRAYTGRTARGIRNAFGDDLGAGAPAAYPEIHHVTAPLRAAARAAEDAQAINLWAGQAYPLAREEPAADVVARLGRELREALARVAGPS